MIKKGGIVGLAALAAILVLVFYVYVYNLRQTETEKGESKSGWGWEAHQKLLDDPADDLAGKPAEVKSGYDIRGVWFRYEESKDIAYFRLDTEGVAGDVDGDGDADTSSARGVRDLPGVGPGETYKVIVDTNLDNSSDFYITYTDNLVDVRYSNNSLIPTECEGSYNDNVVEISVSDASILLPERFQIRGYSGNEYDTWPEDLTKWAGIELRGGEI